MPLPCTVLAGITGIRGEELGAPGPPGLDEKEPEGDGRAWVGDGLGEGLGVAADTGVVTDWTFEQAVRLARTVTANMIVASFRGEILMIFLL